MASNFWSMSSSIRRMPDGVLAFMAARCGGGGGAPTGPVTVVGVGLTLGALPGLGLLPLALGLLPLPAAVGLLPEWVTPRVSKVSATASLKASAIEPGLVDGELG